MKNILLTISLILSICFAQTTGGAGSANEVKAPGLMEVSTFKLTTSPTDTYVLTSDASGNASWQEAAGGGGDFSDGGEEGGAARTIGNTDDYAFGFLQNGVEIFQINDAGHVYPLGNGTTSFGGSSNRWSIGYFNTGYIPAIQTDRIQHTGDVDTYIDFDFDEIEIWAGGKKFIHITENSFDMIRLGTLGINIDIETDFYYYDYGEDRLTFKPKKTVYTPNTTSLGGISVADGGAIAVTAYIMRVVGADEDALLDTDPAIDDGASDGQIVIIQGTADANTVTIADNVNTQLDESASCTLGDGDIISLMWDSHYSMWIELYRSNN